MNVIELVNKLKDEYQAKQELYIGTNGDALSYEYLKGMKRLLILCDEYINKKIEDEYIGRTD